MMNLLELQHVSKLEEGRIIIDDLSFTQKPLQKLAFAGATGSGKTTLLKLIAGLSEPTQGSILFNGKRVKGPNEKLIPGHPSIAYLSQHFELRNHYRVKELLEMANKKSDEEAKAIYQVCRIDHLLTRWTHQLSGGEKQRIALARLLVTSPQLLLLDEPFSNLDPLHKAVLKRVVDDLSNQLGITCILVSHDPADTLSWADEILVIKEGKLIQHGSPETIYYFPVDTYAAALFGDFTVVDEGIGQLFPHIKKTEATDFSILRPNLFRLTSEGDGAEGRVKDVRLTGSVYTLQIALGDATITMHTTEKKITSGNVVYISLID